jgi:hypothetical protein
MSDLRLTGKTPDGTHLALTNNEGTEFTLRITDTLRASVNQPRLTSVPVAHEFETMSVKEIQRRLRHGEPVEIIARDGEISVEKVMRFAGPILQERTFIIDQVQELVVRKDGTRDGETLLELVSSKLVSRGVDSESLSWSTWRQEDSTWTIELKYPNRDGLGVAQWSFDTQRRIVAPQDENSRWLIGQEPSPRRNDTGLIHSEPSHPSRSPQAPNEEFTAPLAPVRETPRLVAIRETPSAGDSSDGITARAKVPSWDEIMFGRPAVVEERDKESENE